VKSSNKLETAVLGIYDVNLILPGSMVLEKIYFKKNLSL
jgi:hypothetical protein